jgi:polyhydroxybutyrate depolymerase
VLAYHGYTDSAEGVRTALGLTAVAQREGFVVAYPQGTLDNGGKTFHQVSYAFHRDRKVDDVKFARVLVDRLVRGLRLNRRAVYATGISNGGDMCFYLACRPRPFVRAIAPIVGCMMAAWSDRFASRPRISVLAVNGTDDQTTLWSGDMANRDGWGSYLGTEDVMRHCVDALRLERSEVGDAGPWPGGGRRIRLAPLASPYPASALTKPDP